MIFLNISLKSNGENSEAELAKMLATLKCIIIELFFQAKSNEKVKIKNVISENNSTISK